jgi:AcrR family transcriptional regulator
MITGISLDDVAAEAGVSVQTILRQFGSRAGLVEATTEYAVAVVTEERTTPVGDVAAAMEVLVEHYEQRGRSSLLMLAQEWTDPQIAAVTDRGRQVHRSWVEQVFAPWLAPNGDGALADLLVVATDVYTWKLLRLDRGLPRAATTARMSALVRAVLAGAGNTGT